MIAITTSNSINVKPRLKSLTLEEDILNNFFIGVTRLYHTNLICDGLLLLSCAYEGQNKNRKKDIKTSKKTNPENFQGFKLVAVGVRLSASAKTGQVHSLEK